MFFYYFFFNDTATTEIYTLSLHDALPIYQNSSACTVAAQGPVAAGKGMQASKCVSGTAATGITASVEGTATSTWWQEGFNIAKGILYLPVPEARGMLVGPAAGFAALTFPGAPASAAFPPGLERAQPAR